MLNFTFQNPTKIIFGKGTIDRIKEEIPSEARVMITYGGGSVLRNGVLSEVKYALRGYDMVEFAGIEPNPDYKTLMAGIKIARERKIDFLLALGGGSVIDGTKFMAAAMVYDDDPFLLLNNSGINIRQAMPLGTVVTLPASGSEMNSRAIISRRELQMKQAIINQCLFPKFSVLDPTKTFTLPVRQIGNGVVDTFVHVIEQYLTYPVGGDVQDRLAEALFLLLIDKGPRALEEPENYEVRANLMWCASLGLNGLIGAGVPQDWAAHRVGYELTVLYELEHAQTLAVIVPAMLKIRAQSKRQKLLQYARRIWGITSGDENSRIDEAIEKTRAFFEKMGLPTYLRDYGISNINIEQILELLGSHGMVNIGENRDVTPETIREIFKQCLQKSG